MAHLFDYLDGYRKGRIVASERPVVRRPVAGVIDVDARGGIAQTAFVEVLEDLQKATRESGVAALWIRNSFTCGELGYYPAGSPGAARPERLRRVALANSPALLSVGGAPRPVLGTNPLAYGIPRPGALPVVIDQASSSTAFVNVRRAAEAGEAISAGWALDARGEPTQDATAALKGALLPFGSHRGGNVALLVEILATLSGASFSIDAPPFDSGDRSPGIGAFLLGIDPAMFAGSVERLGRHFDLLRSDHRVRLPAVDMTSLPDSVQVDGAMLQRLEEEGRGD